MRHQTCNFCSVTHRNYARHEIHFRSTAERLIRSKERIIKLWKSKISEKIPAASRQTEPQLRDSIPIFLDQLGNALSRGVEGLASVTSGGLKESSEEHAQQRATLKEYSLQDVLMEFRILREVLFEVLEQDAQLPVRERDIILSALEQGMADSGARYIAQAQERERAAEDHFRSIVKKREEELEASRALFESEEIHELEEHKRMLQESEERFRQIANALPQIIWTATADFYVDWYNDWWFVYLGLPCGTRWDDADTLPMHPDDVELTRIRLREAVKTGHDFLMEQRFRRGSDGQYRWHLVRGVPVRDSSGRITKWIGSNTDIHEQKILVEKLQEERELRERFVATLSHDLRTPLTAAKMNAQLIIRKGSDPEILYKAAVRISENIDRSDRMIRDLLDANRLNAGEQLPLDVSECDLNGLVLTTLDELAQIYGDRFVVEVAENIIGRWSCSGIKRIIENLCNNAIKYGSNERSVAVRISREGSEHVMISVHNWGNPIAPHDQATLFQQYRRTDSAMAGKQRGWGLGLSLVRGLAEAHGGEVRVESSPEKGTTFFVKLPIDTRTEG